MLRRAILPSRQTGALCLPPAASSGQAWQSSEMTVCRLCLKSRVRTGYCTPHFLYGRKRAVPRPKEAPGLRPWTCCAHARLCLRLRRGRHSADSFIPSQSPLVTAEGELPAGQERPVWTAPVGGALSRYGNVRGVNLCMAISKSPPERPQARA